MHPTLMHEIARYRQADMLREAERSRLAHLASVEADEPRRRLRLSLRLRRARTAFRPLFGH